MKPQPPVKTMMFPSSRFQETFFQFGGGRDSQSVDPGEEAQFFWGAKIGSGLRWEPMFQWRVSLGRLGFKKIQLTTTWDGLKTLKSGK